MDNTKKTAGNQMPARASGMFQSVEQVLYVAVAVALALGGTALFGHAVYQFVAGLGDQSFVVHVLELLDKLLLVFIVTELLHTVRAVITEDVLKLEPFLIIGVVAAIRRFIVISAEASEFTGEDRFRDLITEMAVLVVAIIALGVAIFLVRRTDHTPAGPQRAPGARDDSSRDGPEAQSAHPRPTSR